jgi:acyl carrier protein
VDAISDGVIDVLKTISRRPIEPALTDELVADLRFDSLDVLAVVAEIEDRFNVSIPMEDVPAQRTVADVINSVTALVEQSSRA